MDLQVLGIKGSTQPEIFQGTVDAMVQQLRTNPARFWQDALVSDGPIEIWEMNGERFIANGNHRFQAALQAGIEVPDHMIQIIAKTGLQVPTFLMKDLTWLSGVK